ncbi:hypothetical protein FNF31_02889 [Cafeteria roenbergensis]|uniref:JmjC domain-containing protein n=1 Tax=Cafeteria roenbergensis TaxID=33653 RepID=A0A5A8DDT0_CAFRO|nr:hypothetical protein FNF31_02889 [Cafeteria roenbergensis]
MAAAAVGSSDCAGKSLASVSWTGPMKEYDEQVLRSAKERARADLDLDEWEKQGWASKPIAVAEGATYGHIERVHTDDLSVEAFRERFERANLPVLIGGVVDKWPAAVNWEPERLSKRLRHRMFKCGEDDDGHAVKIKLKYFNRYMATTRDDSPLYIFDSAFTKDDRCKKLMDDFEVPPQFPEDLFQLSGDSRRPPYRWFLMGPRRSGTCLHIDPLATSAWNALVRGRKRWVLFPPDADVPLVRGKVDGIVRSGEDDEAVDYFALHLPRILEKGGGAEAMGCIQFVQHPGETLFVPSGWWHAVLNLDDTVAITQNFASTVNFPRVWLETRGGRPKMARKLLRELSKCRPDLAAQARALNERDGFSMVETPAQRAVKLERRRKREERRNQRKARRAARAASGDGSDSDASTTSTSSSSSSSTSLTDSDSDELSTAAAGAPVPASSSSAAAAAAMGSSSSSSSSGGGGGGGGALPAGPRG